MRYTQQQLMMGVTSGSTGLFIYFRSVFKRFVSVHTHLIRRRMVLFFFFFCLLNINRRFVREGVRQNDINETLVSSSEHFPPSILLNKNLQKKKLNYNRSFLLLFCLVDSLGGSRERAILKPRNRGIYFFFSPFVPQFKRKQTNNYSRANQQEGYTHTFKNPLYLGTTNFACSYSLPLPMCFFLSLKNRKQTTRQFFLL